MLTTPGIIISEKFAYQLAQEIKNGEVKTIVVVNDGQAIGAVLMFPTDEPIDVYQRAIILVSSVNPNFDPTTTLLEPMRFASTENTRRKEGILLGVHPYIIHILNMPRTGRTVQFRHLWDELKVIYIHEPKIYQREDF